MTEVDENETVYIVDEGELKPTIYHKQVEKEFRGKPAMKTECGLTVRYRNDTLHLPAKWAQHFAKACTDCYAKDAEVVPIK